MDFQALILRVEQVVTCCNMLAENPHETPPTATGMMYLCQGGGIINQLIGYGSGGTSPQIII
jgi:hypothetical protein